MDIEQAISEVEWFEASNLLLRVVQRLNYLGRPLWTEEQVSVEGLRDTYRLGELHFLKLESRRIGVVFLQEADPFFWPDVTAKDTLYIHKLAIDTSLVGRNYGLLAISAVCQEADRRGFHWVRLDCDDRPELHRFYKRCGFELVDIKQIEVFKVARYQLLTGTGRRRQKAAPCAPPLSDRRG